MFQLEAFFEEGFEPKRHVQLHIFSVCHFVYTSIIVYFHVFVV